MLFLVKVRVNGATLSAFAAALQGGKLDRSCVKSDTWCLRDDPAVGFSVWESGDRAGFEKRFKAWRAFYSEVDVSEVTTPQEAMKALMRA